MKIKYSNIKRHILGAQHAYQAQIGDDSFAGATFRRAEENKKKKGRKEGKKKDTETVANWLFAQTTHVVGSKSNFAWWVACGV